MLAIRLQSKLMGATPGLMFYVGGTVLTASFTYFASYLPVVCSFIVLYCPFFRII
jgi:hypothetical protein